MICTNFGHWTTSGVSWIAINLLLVICSAYWTPNNTQAHTHPHHYNGVIMDTIASQIVGLTIVDSTVYSDQRPQQSKSHKSVTLFICHSLVAFHQICIKKLNKTTQRPWWSYRTLQWGYNGLDGVSNHQPHHCLLNRLFRRISKETSKLRVNSPHKWPVTRKIFPFDGVIMRYSVHYSLTLAWFSRDEYNLQRAWGGSCPTKD